ncbi:hypothetical protein E4T56_gene16685 [Termitomyces sp. T112]|nr:hypothetical protein E4T56_gene16685 [Termitomyces sp. T112]
MQIAIAEAMALIGQQHAHHYNRCQKTCGQRHGHRISPLSPQASDQQRQQDNVLPCAEAQQVARHDGQRMVILFHHGLEALDKADARIGYRARPGDKAMDVMRPPHPESADQRIDPNEQGQTPPTPPTLIRLMQPGADKANRQRDKVCTSTGGKKQPEPQEIHKEMSRHRKRRHPGEQHLTRQHQQQQGHRRRFVIPRLVLRPYSPRAAPQQQHRQRGIDRPGQRRIGDCADKRAYHRIAGQIGRDPGDRVLHRQHELQIECGGITAPDPRQGPGEPMRGIDAHVKTCHLLIAAEVIAVENPVMPGITEHQECQGDECHRLERETQPLRYEPVAPRGQRQPAQYQLQKQQRAILKIMESPRNREGGEETADPAGQQGDARGAQHAFKGMMLVFRIELAGPNAVHVCAPSPLRATASGRTAAGQSAPVCLTNSASLRSS